MYYLFVTVVALACGLLVAEYLGLTDSFIHAFI